MSTANPALDPVVEAAYLTVRDAVARLAEAEDVHVDDILRQAYELQMKGAIEENLHANIRDLHQVRQLLAGMTRPPEGEVVAQYVGLAKKTRMALDRRGDRQQAAH